MSWMPKDPNTLLLSSHAPHSGCNHVMRAAPKGDHFTPEANDTPAVHRQPLSHTPIPLLLVKLSFLLDSRNRDGIELSTVNTSDLQYSKGLSWLSPVKVPPLVPLSSAPGSLR
jgi:hypothetical protein